MLLSGEKVTQKHFHTAAPLWRQYESAFARSRGFFSITDYVNITSSNNIFPDSPLVTSDANNPGNVTIRVINEKGAQVGETKTIAPGSSVRLDQIPAFSGTYTIQGKASVAGTYTFNID